MRATAQLAAERHVLGATGDHSHHVAVLLAKQGNGTGGLGLLNAADLRDDRLGREDLDVHEVLDLVQLLGREGLEVREVKAQAVVVHERPRLVDVLAKHGLERGVEQVRGRVVATDELAAVSVDRGGHDVTLVERALKDLCHVRVQAVVTLRVRDLELGSLGDERAGVAHLAAHLGVERRAVEQNLDL